DLTLRAGVVGGRGGVQLMPSITSHWGRNATAITMITSRYQMMVNHTQRRSHPARGRGSGRSPLSTARARVAKNMGAVTAHTTMHQGHSERITKIAEQARKWTSELQSRFDLVC